MPQNGQTHLKNLAVNTARLLKSLRPLFRHCKLEWKHLETTLYESLEKELVSQTCMIRYYYSHLSSKNLHKILLLSSLDHSKPKHTLYQRQQYFKILDHQTTTTTWFKKNDHREMWNLSYGNNSENRVTSTILILCLNCCLK